MSVNRFRCAFFTTEYEATVSFYENGLEFPVEDHWDRGPNDRGTVFAAASGFIETLALPSHGDDESIWDFRPPQGFFLVIEVDNVESMYQRALEKKLPIREKLLDQHWGHRSFRVSDPNGIALYIFSEIDRGDPLAPEVGTKA